MKTGYAGHTTSLGEYPALIDEHIVFLLCDLLIEVAFGMGIELYGPVYIATGQYDTVRAYFTEEDVLILIWDDRYEKEGEPGPHPCEVPESIVIAFGAFDRYGLAVVCAGAAAPSENEEHVTFDRLVK